MKLSVLLALVLMMVGLVGCGPQEPEGRTRQDQERIDGGSGDSAPEEETEEASDES
jgi:hypothetical protein